MHSLRKNLEGTIHLKFERGICKRKKIIEKEKENKIEEEKEKRKRKKKRKRKRKKYDFEKDGWY